MGRTAVIIVAAGRGTRAGGEVAKQWQPLAGRAVLDWTVDAFRAAPGVDHIALVLHPQEMDRAARYQDAQAVAGGDTRGESVRAGLAALAADGVDRVLIHDAARPLVSQRIIADVLAALDHARGAAPALEVTDALWRGADGIVTGLQERAGLYRAQTPQGFDFRAILDAHDAFEGVPADDVEVARAAGIEVVMVPGEERNLKLTRPADFARAAALLGATMDIRVGNGFDVHSFGPGERVILCGVAVPHDRALTGHSDADVGMHAVTDALYGALGLGDIGRHFPPSDDRWKGADSAVFLRHAVDQATAHGFTISNIDLTLICERPKIGPHAAEMTRKMGEIMGLDPARLSIKATTSERLGFTGREEGIAAMATALLTGAG
ncbi:bifunctional 2-C-methyl-D-erythritol 4-phosphate cytidylyltransferase/2-C-methyl-D-erythritol 2,4-cyclodiphosphate synthase [Psychromarinibacter sp. C21-152]|uniref:Bifunctional enzyme IspD/IspF n=1 Tax=Psychromarinibacter sediminicola TaxID=3033385 RepID=A0AAE3NQ20_9RHOB|nr:bifunctional 2-C-methyl-D-erythritol 4-phosphate cytidylyltransferase/2-C-methyl-D-erythritol 2,4-cyclodiphosphate synthase [Psychromarinibacter sediminicola]MDF0602058.1 bifunctional 2-C-methyl-D-erythritol 4-phosphate cytidylyltransferase/2-C-methyl-D-erythritol 2,4-cyclodiphosphate synthase [Psychromarinibacter sediminicola]